MYFCWRWRPAIFHAYLIAVEKKELFNSNKKDKKQSYSFEAGEFI